MSFMMLDIDESFSKASLGYFYTLTTSPAQTRTSLPSKTPGGELDADMLLVHTRYLPDFRDFLVLRPYLQVTITN